MLYGTTEGFLPAEQSKVSSQNAVRKRWVRLQSRTHLVCPGSKLMVGGLIEKFLKCFFPECRLSKTGVPAFWNPEKSGFPVFEFVYINSLFVRNSP